ncbi:GAF domain-containing protein [Vineibacter terrae]|uniref:histidine kinase n=1 Tax=Vineibacter terrae TaxID=2586908 RepID=A0A5C8PAZ8_9HYPH|nr:GAF domain-containing protein [Vineibacter terrae]TXL70860.1 GAF domain-containing protein [Vineibacter terrae]
MSDVVPARRGLFAKYIGGMITVVTLVLVVNRGIDVWVSYQDTRAALSRIQQEKAIAAAQGVEQYVSEIERQIGWTTHAQWAAGSIDQRYYDFNRLMRQVPDITELVDLDGNGRERLKVSRVAMNVIGSDADWSEDPRFKGILDKRVWFSPIYWRRESEPYMTMSLARAGRRSGATVAEVNLKLIVDVINAIKVGKAGYAYVVNRDGRLIAHPDISQVLRNTDMARLSHVQAALRARQGSRDEAPRATVGVNLANQNVLSAAASIPALDWLVFVELPLNEALQPLYASLIQTGLLLLFGIALAAGAAWVLARHMIVPIRVLSAGAARLGGGDLTHRIAVRSGDELETLGSSFNRMAEQLQESYANLEHKVEARTQELARSVDELTASGEILRLIAGTPEDLRPVFQSILQHGTRLCEANFSVLWTIHGDVFRLVALHNIPPALASHLDQDMQSGPDTAIGPAMHSLTPNQIEDTRMSPAYIAGDLLHRAFVDQGGVRSMLSVPMVHQGELIGLLSIFRHDVGRFADKHVNLMSTFADQAVIAVENSRLLRELRTRSEELSESLEYQTATSDVLKVISGSAFNLVPVLKTVAETAATLCCAAEAALFLREGDTYRWAASVDSSNPFLDAVREQHFLPGRDSLIGRIALEGKLMQIEDVLDDPEYGRKDLAQQGGVRTLLGVPLVREGIMTGVMVLTRHHVEAFTDKQVEVLRVFADQAVIAVENVRLFTEIQEKSRQLELASQHKSQFLANMSHELRTPLNAVLGYAELLIDGIYGELPDRARGVLERMQSNGQHLLGLINEVLDLSKIEAGQLKLTLDTYALSAIVQTVVAATESLASAKGLKLKAVVAANLPAGVGDERRLAQVLLNLVGNAIKFTDQGSVEIVAVARGPTFEIAVSDTGPGIAAEDQTRIFEEFQQIDNTSTRRKGGTGLGLAISRRIVAMHGGALIVESALGRGSTFRVVLPVKVDKQQEAA